MIVNSDQHAITLLPGELYISTDQHIVKMILGTCVSVILYNQKKKVGAICHAQLPEQKSHIGNCIDTCPNPCYRDSPDTNVFKFVTCSVRYMVESLNKIGISNRDLVAYLIGGASVLLQSQLSYELATSNIYIAEQMLHSFGIPIIKQDTGGQTGRNISFEMATGNVTIKPIKNSNPRISV